MLFADPKDSSRRRNHRSFLRGELGFSRTSSSSKTSSLAGNIPQQIRVAEKQVGTIYAEE